MRRKLSERTIVAILFVMVLVTFALAHEDSKKMERLYLGFNNSMLQDFGTLADNDKANSELNP